MYSNLVDFKSIWWCANRVMPQDFFLFTEVNRPKRLELVGGTTIYAHYYYDDNRPVVMEIRYPNSFDFKGFAELSVRCDEAREQWADLENQMVPRFGVGSKQRHYRMVTEKALREQNEIK